MHLGRPASASVASTAASLGFLNYAVPNIHDQDRPLILDDVVHDCHRLLWTYFSLIFAVLRRQLHGTNLIPDVLTRLTVCTLNIERRLDLTAAAFADAAHVVYALRCGDETDDTVCVHIRDMMASLLVFLHIWRAFDLLIHQKFQLTRRCVVILVTRRLFLSFLDPASQHPTAFDRLSPSW
ncbi:hypothetical protein ANO11243_032380 [Dothideomycetidae sp. 11243]|nr:hypothetical protein ANO11243_032380 [fungal sp. No.11243]